VDLPDHHLLLVKITLVSQHDRIGLRPDSRHIDRLAESDIQSLALTDRIKRIALMPAQNIPLLVYKIAAVNPLFQTFHPALQKAPVIIVRYKTDFIALTLLR